MSSALVFDAYGTLFDVHSVLERCEALWPGKGAQLSRAWRAKQLEYTWLRSLMCRYAPFSQVTREALLFSCESLQLNIGEQETQSLMNEYLRLAPYPEVAQVLQRLSDRRLAILTNGSPDMIGPLVKNRAMEKVFDAVLSVDELKLFKPAPAAYELAVKKLNVPKERIEFVSSNCWDALGAKSFGFKAHWINRSGAPAERLGLDPDAVISSMNDLDRRLQE